MACPRDVLTLAMSMKQPQLTQVGEVSFEVDRRDVAEENEESLIERTVLIRDLSILFLRLRAPGSYLIFGDPVDVRLCEVTVRMATVLPVRTVVPDKCEASQPPVAREVAKSD